MKRMQRHSDKDGGREQMIIHNVAEDASNQYSSKDDQYIWNAFRLYKESAFIFIYSKYFPDLINYGHQFAKEDQLVEDCIQDIFIDLRRNRESLTNKVYSIKLYLFKALKRRILEYRRKNKYVEFESAGYEDFEIVPSFETVLIQGQIVEERKARIMKSLSKLTVRQKEALFYLFYENMSYSEIRELMNLDHVRSVRNLVYKALSVLKSAVMLLITFPFWA